MKTYKGQITELKENEVFVFGSNTQGRHGKGSALWARLNAGAIYGQSRGAQGQSYSICTKDLTKLAHPSIADFEIKAQIYNLYKFAKETPHKDFIIAYSGTGINLNGYTPQQMADMFSASKIPENVVFEEDFAKLLYHDKSI